MAKIENPKNYSGRDLETIFFRPMLSGPDARALGIKVMYNTPVPTTLQFWKRAGDILQQYTAAGWKGGDAATKYSKQIALSKVKAEAGYSAEDYFNMVYELITGRPDVNLDDLTGTELEAAETALFKEAIAESIRATMWLGDTEREGALSTFDGFLKRLLADTGDTENEVRCTGFDPAGETAEKLLKRLWDEAPDVLRAFKPQGELVYLVTSDIYARYEEELDGVVLEAAYLAKQNGREGLSFRGIPVIDIQVAPYLRSCPELPQSFALLTDRRNLALAVNTADFPGTEVRMWYNPDQMENRQRMRLSAPGARLDGCRRLRSGTRLGAGRRVRRNAQRPDSGLFVHRAGDGPRGESGREDGRRAGRAEWRKGHVRRNARGNGDRPGPADDRTQKRRFVRAHRLTHD